VENLLKTAVESEVPDIKDQVMSNLNPHKGIRLIQKGNGWKFAVLFAGIVLAGTAALILPNFIQPTQSGSGFFSASSNQVKMSQANPFTLVAYAAMKTSVPCSSSSYISGYAAESTQPKKKFGLSLTRPIGVSGMDFSDWERTKNGASPYDEFLLLKDDGANQTFANYVGFNLKCVGKHIRSITFKTDRGIFAQIKNLTVKEQRRILDSMDRNPDYCDGKSMETSGMGQGDRKGLEERIGFLPIGDSYTIAYKDQDDYRIQYACRLTKTYSKKEVEEWDKKDIRTVVHNICRAMNGTIITITANYEDGSTASKQCCLTLDPDTGIFTAVEK
jgi:hypothetical protein